MNNYIKSFTKKMDKFLWKEEFTNIIYLHDKEDNERLDQVLFLKKNNEDVVGFYIRGTNPLISVNKVHNLDDFNLFATYDELIEYEENDFNLFKTECIRLYFNPNFHELLGIYLSDINGVSSLIILFLQDEIQIVNDCKISDIDSVFEKFFLQVSVGNMIVYEKINPNSIWMLL
ncbi:hypothetical protein [Lysinibacillus sp. G4S2]|uniref:hypothetical protein n=1 Tax=Lysinibacillus sp. G4S2 TaxID=3055859 RepID=UPI0025A0EE11|nr:hypothetical protein [Lysinibacillus sp. G4S2]MDM5247982.1 hypothetical protein [Lysinibacillus sp. G4S2]